MKEFKLEVDAENNKCTYSCEGIDLIAIVRALSTVIDDMTEKAGEDKELVRYVFFKLVAGEFVNLGSFALGLLDTWLRIKVWLKHF